MGPTADLPVATNVSAGDYLVIETASGYKRLDYATLLSSQTVDLGDLGEGFGTGVGNLSLRHVPTDYVADGVTVGFLLKDSSGATYTPAPGDVVLAFVGGVLDVTVVQTGSTVSFSSPPPNGERVRMCIFSPVAGTNTAALDARYAQLLSPPASGYVLEGGPNGELLNSGVVAVQVLTTANVGATNGVAPLNASNVVAVSYLPAAALLGADGDAFAADHPTNSLGHSTATTTDAGFMSAADKVKLDNLPNTANLNTGVTKITMNGTDYTGAVVVNYTAILAAPEASPNLTGTPTAPNAAAGTNTNQIATTAFVQGEKVNTALTGIPTAPTAANGTNSTQLATTAFVNNAFGQANLAQYATVSYSTGAFQGLNAKLTNISNANTNGFLVVSDQANGAVVRRTLVAGTGVNITNTDGVSGNPVISANIPSLTNVTPTPVAILRPLTSFNQANISNVPVSGCAFTSSPLQVQEMDLSAVAAVDVSAIVSVAGSTGARIGAWGSPNGGTTKYALDGTVITAGTQPANLAASTVAANATGVKRAQFTLPAAVQVTNALVGVFACNGNGADTVAFGEVRVSAPALTTSSGAATWGTITGSLGAQSDLVAVLQLKADQANVGVAGGIATLNTAGKVPPAQLPTFTVGASYGVFDASDPAYAGGLTPGTGNAVHNNAVYDALFAEGRTVTNPYYILPPGEYYVSESVSPSGKGIGVGANPGSQTWECRGHTIRFQNSSAYMDVRRGAGTGSLLSAFTPKMQPGANCIPNDGLFFTGAGYTGVPKKVALNLRSGGFMRILGDLTLIGTGQADLVAVGSSGGNDNFTGGFLLRGAHIQDLTIRSFEVGLHFMGYQCGDAQVDPATNVHIDDYQFYSGVCAYANDVNSDAGRIDKFIISQTGSCYQSGGLGVHFGTGFLTITGASTRGPLFCLGGVGTTSFDSIYVHQNSDTINLHYGIFNVGQDAVLEIGEIHQDLGTGFAIPGTTTPGASIYIGSDMRGQACSGQQVTVRNCSQKTQGDNNTDATHRQLIALDCGTSFGTKRRRINVNNWDDNNSWKPIAAVKTTGGFAATTTDMCDVGFISGRRQFKFNNGVYTAVTPSGAPGGY